MRRMPYTHGATNTYMANISSAARNMASARLDATAHPNAMY